MKRKMVLQVEIEVDFETWAENNNGPWASGPGRQLNAEVREDIKNTVQHQLAMADIFEMTDAKVTVR